MDSVRGEEDIYLIRTDTFCSQLWEINGLSKMKLLSLTTLRSNLQLLCLNFLYYYTFEKLRGPCLHEFRSKIRRRACY